MHPRAAELITLLNLEPHPEGGRFREDFRSSCRVQPEGTRPARSAVTAIYFLLTAGEHSRWHRVASDELWHFCEGAPLDLHLLDPGLKTAIRHRLGPAATAAAPLQIVPAGWWQAANPLGDYTLVSCTVAPGFDFADFSMLAESPAAADLKPRFPDLVKFL